MVAPAEEAEEEQNAGEAVIREDVSDEGPVGEECEPVRKAPWIY